jgi:HK97 family phage major capsid protein
MNNSVQKELDQLVDVLDKKINDRVDAIEVQAKRSTLSSNSKQSFQNIISKGIKDNKKKKDFVIKAGELFVSEVTGTPVAPQVVPDFKNTPFPNDIRLFLNQSTTSSDSVTVNRATFNANNAAETAEGAAYPTSTNTLTAVNVAMKKFTHKFQLSEEFLADVSGASQFITNQITGGLITKLNADIITDILANDTDFAAGAFANAISQANELDVLCVMVAQLRLSNYNPSVIFLNPNDYTKIQLLKSSASEYLNANRNELFGNNSLNGVTIAQSPAVTSGVCHIMDAQRYGAFYNRQQVSVQVGYDGSDFSEGQRTAICVQRGSLVVFDTGACVSATFSNAKTALED